MCLECENTHLTTHAVASQIASNFVVPLEIFLLRDLAQVQSNDCRVDALQVKQQFHDVGFMADVDVDPGCTLNKKIRNAQLAQYNFILGKHATVCAAWCV